jgi:hypothetical protein
MEEGAAAVAEMLDCWSLFHKINLMLNTVDHKTGFYSSDRRSNDRRSLRSFETGYYHSDWRSNDRRSLRRFKTGFYRSTWRSNDRSSFRRFTLPAGTIFRPPSALPEAVLWGGRISHWSRFLHVLLRFLFSFHFVSTWQTFFWLQVTL